MNEQRTTLNAYLKRTYRMTEDEYEDQLASQGYVCEICRGLNPRRSDGTRERLAVDHNHATLENRGLLCQRCNRVLGMLGDSQELAQRILEYLRRYDGSPIPFTPPNLDELVYAVSPVEISSQSEPGP